MSKHQKAWAHFDYWFDRHGHWMYGTESYGGKKAAEEAWSKNGIDGLPDYPGQR